MMKSLMLKIIASGLVLSGAATSNADTQQNMTISEDTTLHADAVYGTVTVESGATLNLNSHTLTASAIAGAGSIDDTAVDFTVPDTNNDRVTCTNTLTGGVAANLFNNNYARNGTDNTKRIIIHKDNLPLVVDYDLQTAYVVNMYRVYSGPMDGWIQRCPKKWEFYGSNDNETWTLLDSQSDISWPTEQTTREYEFENTTAYRHYRFKAIESNSEYLEIVQLEYCCSNTGELRLDVPSGTAMTNSAVALSGKLKLVKIGEGAYVAAKGGNSYTGGTVVEEGSIGVSSSDIADPFGTVASVDVYATADGSSYGAFNMMDGSTLDLRGCGGPFDATNCVFADGANVAVDVSGRALDIEALVAAWSSKPQNVTFAFASDATYPVVRDTGLYYGAQTHVAEFAWWTGSANDGDPMNSENWRCVHANGNIIEGVLPTSMTTIYIDGNVALQPSAECSLAPYACVVSNCTLLVDCDWRVFGTLEIAEGCTLSMNGHKLYASGISGSGTIAGTGDLTEPDVNGNHVSSTNTFHGSSNATVLFNNNYARNGYADDTRRLIIHSNNLPFDADYDFGTPTLVEAYNVYCGPIDGWQARNPKAWNFYGSNDKINWTLLDSQSDISWDDTQTTRLYEFANSTAYRYYRFQGVSCRSEYFEMVQLEYFGPVADELHVDTPADSTVTNSSVTLSGRVKLVKEGDGTFVAAKTNQTYCGGNEVLSGVLSTPASSGADGAWSANMLAFGIENSSITAREGAVFDISANYDFFLYNVILDGGTFANTVSNMTMKNWGGSGFKALTADSTLNVGKSIVFGQRDAVDLGGNTLTVNISSGSYLYLRNSSMTNGTVHIPTGGYLQTVVSCDARTVDFKVGCSLNMASDLSVRNYEAVYKWNDNTGTAALNVYGTFTPATNYFYGCTMQDGSTIDLSSKTDTWSTTSSFTSGSKTVTFADNATVTVDIGSRSVACGAQLVSWTTAPTNLDTLTFRCISTDDPTGSQISLRKNDDGLYVWRGMFLIVR